MIPFNKASFSDKEKAYIAGALESGKVAGEHVFTKLCQDILEKRIGAKKALLTTSCTHALEMAAILLDIGPGDEVIVPAFTFVSTANAFALRGATIVFCDIRRDTLNLDERLLENLITPKTKAVVPVHYAGVGCNMDAIMEISNRRGIAVVEDNAHGLFGTYGGRPLGSFGCMATQSFHETKNITCGEGGALLINDERYIERAEIIREKGTNRSQFFRGEIDKYSWVDLGSSYVMSDLLAAALLGQLERADEIQARRHEIWYYYDAELASWSAINNVELPSFYRNTSHMYQLIMPSLEVRTRFMSYLKERGVQSTFHYGPLNQSPFGRKFGGSCPVTEDIADRLVRLPLYVSLTNQEQEYIINTIKSFK